MFIDFAFYLTVGVIVLGIIVLIDKLFLRKKRLLKKGREPIIIEYARSLFPILLLVWVIRSFIIQPYRVPTGSLEPTILPGDFIAVWQFSYGLRLPATEIKLISVGEPKRGDIALFRFPKNPNVIFVKRVIGLPGDHLVYKNKILTINGVEAKQKDLGITFVDDPYGIPRKVQIKQESLLGIKHKILVQPYGGETKNIDVTIPAGHYFMMGDNRDDSDDSRIWGFVPEKNLIGKAFGIWMSWNSETDHVRWHRIGKGIH